MHRWIVLLSILALPTFGQGFSSGSTGADGALNITAAGVTVFNQTPVGGGTVFNFTTINIAAGSTLRLSGQVYSSPLYFLAQGAVTVSGTIDLSGANGNSYGSDPTLRVPSTPGAGGYSGGVGVFGTSPAENGNGPGGGTAGGTGCALYGTFTGDQFLVPLIGGSGGAGSGSGVGGAGGGAILIASSVSITVTGSINANGGIPVGGGGYGSSGAIRLAAPSIAGNGPLTAANFSGCSGTYGIVRLEAFQDTYNAGVVNAQLYEASPFNTFLPTAVPSVQVVSIGGVTVPSSPAGSFTVPDIVLNSSAPLPIQIQAQNIPLGTTATLYFFSENGPDQAITSTGLAGSVGNSTATASVTLPSGYSRGYVKATWTQ
jgi:hypothetical protein